jgi:hypothetical protein
MATKKKIAKPRSRRKRAATRIQKPPPKVDVRNLWTFVRESHVVADAMRGSWSCSRRSKATATVTSSS